MTGPMIIGLAGKARNGKSQVGMYLNLLLAASRRGLTCRQAAFADALKTEARAFGWDGSKGPAGRFFLQHLGTERRTQDPEYWIRPVEAILSVSVDLTIITDCRFRNEAEWVKERGGEMWRIIKIGGANDLGALSEHPSETNLDDWNFDVRIEAEAGDLDSLYEDARTNLDAFLARHR